MTSFPDRIREVIWLLRFSGLRHVLRILRYTFFKERLDRRYQQSRDRAKAIFPKLPIRLLKSEPISRGARFHFENAELEISFLTPDMVRITWEPGSPPIPYALVEVDWPEVEVTFQSNPPDQLLSTASIQILVKTDGSLKFYDHRGHLLHYDLPPSRQSDIWTAQADLAIDERVYGLGEQSSGLDLRGGTYRMWNTDPGGSYGPGAGPLYTPIPLYLGLHSQGSYLVFYENYCPATFHLPGRDQPTLPARVIFDGGMLRYYFISGKPPHAIKRYTDLTGRAWLPPRWSLGYHQSRWGYKDEKDIRQVVAGFKAHDMPVNAIHLDIDYMDGYRLFTVDRSRFPNLAGLASELAEQDIRLVPILDVGVKQDPNYFLYREGLDGGMFCKLPNGKTLLGLVWPGWSVYPDFTDPKVRFWWSQQYSLLLREGIAGIWHDMNEPTSFAAWGEFMPPLATCHAMESQGGDHRQAHNIYALLMNRAGWEALHLQRPAQRPWIISRAGWAGQQRYAWNWTGDTESSWAALRMAIGTVLGMGLSGLPFTGPDIGGFSGNPSAELYLRSFQMATFLPFFRTHSAIGTARREPWVYGEPWTGIVRRYLQLRESLMPYLYTLAWEASQTGAPLARPLFWLEPADASLWDVNDAFLLGDTLLVAPVLEANGATQAVTPARPVTLPDGEWVSFWDDTRWQGPGQINVPAPFEQIPLLVRASSVMPMQEGDRLVLHIYPLSGGNMALRDSAAGSLYSDAGDGYSASRLDRFFLSRDGNCLVLDWESQGDYPFPYSEVELQIHGIAPINCWIDGEKGQRIGDRIKAALFRQARFDL
jgi:alpha-glucosidase